jgi:DNA-binding response OmpR family regulator
MEKRILIIDNDVEMEEIFKEMFSGTEYTVFYYEETDDILELVSDHRPHIVVLDYNLNGLNGGELCKQIKADEQSSGIPVILFSAFPKFIYSPENYGYDAFIEKPFDIDELTNKVEELVSQNSTI